MIALYNPSFLQLYQIDVLHLGMSDAFVLIGLVTTFIIYALLSAHVFPRRYIQLMKKQSARDVQKAMIKREYINDFEKII